MPDFESLGLGLRYGTVHLVRVPESWAEVAAVLCQDVAEALGSLAIAVEHMGSTAVPSLLAKPVIDLAVGVAVDPPIAAIQERLTGLGWIYRGDAGASGGHVFVLETRPWHRVAHVHVVQHDGEQWRRYLALRALLRADPIARQRYDAAKLELQARFDGDNVTSQYTQGKSDVIAQLLQL